MRLKKLRKFPQHSDIDENILSHKNSIPRSTNVAHDEKWKPSAIISRFQTEKSVPNANRESFTAMPRFVCKILTVKNVSTKK